MLTGRQIAESGMLTGFEEKNIQQQGVDIRIAKVNKVKGKLGVVPETGKTILPDYEPIQPLHYMKNEGERIYGWMLGPGVYDIEFVEGVNIDSFHAMKPLTRSSLVRMGARIDSGLYDAGFNTEHCGAMLYVTTPVIIAVNARVAQIVCLESDEVHNLYNGQFQNDKQRGAK